MEAPIKKRKLHKSDDAQHKKKKDRKPKESSPVAPGPAPESSPEAEAAPELPAEEVLSKSFQDLVIRSSTLYDFLSNKS
jgi:hypothetical protein